MDSSQMRNLKDEFNFQLNVLRQKMTYQLFLDLKNVEDSFADVIRQKQASGQDVEEQDKTIKQKQTALTNNYIQSINQLQKLQFQAELKIKQQEMQSDLSQLQNLKEVNDKCNISSTIDLFQQLIQRQQHTIAQIQQYLEKLFERIQHERYVQQQKEINHYLQRQTGVFMARKEQLRLIIENVKAERKQWYDIAREVCLEKEDQIKHLQTSKSEQQQQVQKQKQCNLELNLKQAQLYKEIAKLTLELNTNSLKSIKSECLDQSRPKMFINHSSQKEFRQKNFGSIIQPIPFTERESPSMIFSQQSDFSAQTKAPTCFVDSDIKKEFNSKKPVLSILSLLTIVMLVYLIASRVKSL